MAPWDSVGATARAWWVAVGGSALLAPCPCARCGHAVPLDLPAVPLTGPATAGRASSHSEPAHLLAAGAGAARACRGRVTGRASIRCDRRSLTAVRVPGPSAEPGGRPTASPGARGHVRSRRVRRTNRVFLSPTPATAAQGRPGRRPARETSCARSAGSASTSPATSAPTCGLTQVPPGRPRRPPARGGVTSALA